jgi:hypothetical protein
MRIVWLRAKKNRVGNISFFDQIASCIHSGMIKVVYCSEYGKDIGNNIAVDPQKS